MNTTSSSLQKENNFIPVSTDELSQFEIERGFEEKGLPSFRLREIAQRYDFEFLGNGAEGICIKADVGEDESYCIKIFYHTGLEEDLARDLLKGTRGKHYNIFWNNQNPATWNSDIDWHIRMLGNTVGVANLGSERLVKEVQGQILGNQVAPSIIDYPIGFVETDGNILCGYIQHYYEGSFCCINEVRPDCEEALNALEQQGIQVDESINGFNAVRLPDNTIRIFDLGIR